MLNAKGWVWCHGPASLKSKNGRTLSTSIPLSSANFHVFPTEKEPLELSLDLWMKPTPLLDSTYTPSYS